MTSEPRPRIYVLDTSVLVHDPTALFSFEEHHVCIPGAVLEELDSAKEGLSEVARNARQVSRFLDQLLAGRTPAQLSDGLPLGAGGPGQPTGRLFFEIEHHTHGDTAILAAARSLNARQGEFAPVLVSKDINLRIRAQVSGIAAEDYESDRAIDDIDLLPTGVAEIPAQTWEQAQQQGECLRLPVPPGAAWRVNQCLFTERDNFEGIIRSIADGWALLAPLRDFRAAHSVWGIRGRNREQNFALNLLMDPEIDLVTLLGSAGTGKTLLTLAAGLSQTMDENRYREVIATRATVAIGEEIGYLPGTEEEKMTPWMGALMDNLEVLASPGGSSGDWGRAATADLLHSRVRIRSLSFMRGRTFLEKFVILDEAQNLTAKQMKTLITRAGPGTKVICLGNIGQIDTPYLTESTSGLTYVVDRLKDWPHSGHVTLQRGERSRLADYASEAL
ncbi:predicted ATPase related to phosphate starvation-inducible protein PhoH [Halorhodospira halochloris]|uniref:Predicted ATPase related to phosphate starvation-inducible protein PhoH n=1 Tax=Halorhodospira halochloris TaxID=1052 RepID=A0A0X8X796_HALHR|nr:PhoH family protein [Halorhodospira halochloris]MBK1652273.1 phosphate starvation-inducible protein PhoH [Halorhodospira halochloris]BAU56932.1 predicted ATPase related to phosphate starvation-inducible protein PhoH [Halorhodospira halochloris]